MSLVQLTQHVAKRFPSGVATLLTSGVVLACRHLQSIVDNGSYSEPANPTISLSTALGSQPLLRSVEMWGLQSLKIILMGDRSPFHRTLWRGGLSPFYLRNFYRDIVSINVNLYSFSFEFLTP